MNSNYAIVRVAGTFIGLLLGSAFASGQEALQFYAAYGVMGIAGGCVSMLLFAYIGYALLTAGKVHSLITSEQVFKFYCGRFLGLALTWYGVLFLASIYLIMLVGAGATLHQAYGLNEYVGSGVMGALSVATVLLGLRRIVDVLGVVGPILIVITIIIGIWTLFDHGGELSGNLQKLSDLNLMQASSSWLTSSVLYVGFSIMGLASFLPAVGSTLNSQRQVLGAATLGPFLLMLAMILISMALISRIEEIVGVQMPVIVLANGVMPAAGTLFAVILFLCIYTTASPLLWAVCAKFSPETSPRFKVLALLLTIIGVLGGGYLPFDKLVNFIYPTVGYAGAVFVAFVIFADIHSVFNRRRER